jgi:hypothetical protein
LQSGDKKALPNVKLSSDTWRRRWDSPAPLQQSAGLLQPGGTQSAGHGLFESRLATPCIVCRKNKKAAPCKVLLLAQTVGFEPTWHCCQIDFEFFGIYRN